jgi:hypothetical protein
MNTSMMQSLSDLEKQPESEYRYEDNDFYGSGSEDEPVTYVTGFLNHSWADEIQHRQHKTIKVQAKAKAKKNEQKPPKKLSGFDHFCRTTKGNMWRNGETSDCYTKICQMWRNLSTESIAYWKDVAEQANQYFPKVKRTGRLTGYNLYFKEMMPKMIKDGVPQKQRMKTIGLMWRNLPDETKLKYQKNAAN